MLNIIFLAGLLFSGNPNSQRIEVPKPVQAISTSNFLSSIGVNSAISKRGETLEQTISITKYLGIRWIRTGYEGDIPLDDLIKLHEETGMKYSYGLLSGGTDIPKLIANGKILAKNNALLAFEGLNEPNNWGLTYKGVRGGSNNSWKAVAEVQRDLYTAVKNEALLKTYPVWDLCENGAQTDNMGLQYLQIPKGAGAQMPEGTKYADFAVCHNYFLHPSHPGLYDNQTWNAADPGPACKVDGLYGNYGNTWKNKFKGYTEKELINLPKVTTETGVVIEGDVTEEKQAKLYLNLYLSQFKRKWNYTAIYLLRDRSDEAGNQSFGFYTKDYKPRKAALYLHNFTTILADQGKVSPLKSLNYNISNQPETVHDLLLQKSNGKFALVIWGEKAKGTETVSLNLDHSYPEIKIFDPTLGTGETIVFKDAISVKFAVSDHPIIIEL
ncbi:hypothetical protein ACXZ1K_11750 [Pedobacter sp. PWIIR3]